MELQYELDNDVLLIPPLIEQLQQVAFDLGLIDRTDSLRFARSLLEALRNAIYHGNLELPFDQIKTADRSADAASQLINERLEELPFRDRRIHVQGTFSTEEAKITVRDDGHGFDTSILPDVQADPSLLCKGEGRGLVLIAAFMDEFRITPPGNEITLIKRKKTPA
jgi:anti-sigma regulatory factor (Ser/Thr protein kinase)